MNTLKREIRRTIPVTWRLVRVHDRFVYGFDSGNAAKSWINVG